MTHQVQTRWIVLVVCAVGLAHTSGAAAQSSDRQAAAEPARPALSASPVLDAREIKIDGRPIRGAQDGKVTIVFFDDFQCPYSASMYQRLFDEVMKDYAGLVKVALRDAPNAEIHPWAKHAAIDANCLAAQHNDAYWDFADYVHAHQSEITGDPPGELDKLALEQGHKHNLDVRDLQECLRAQSDTRVRQSSKDAYLVGVRAVPTLFVNGENLRGEHSTKQLREAIDRALHALGEAAPTPGTKPATPTEQTTPGAVEPMQAPKQMVN